MIAPAADFDNLFKLGLFLIRHSSGLGVFPIRLGDFDFINTTAAQSIGRIEPFSSLTVSSFFTLQ